MLRPGPRTRDHRRRIYEILERGDPSDAVSVAVDRLIVALIILNLAAVALETVPRLGSDYAWLFETVEIVSLVAFSVEYALRVWVAVEHTPFQRLSPFVARLRYM